MQLYLIRHGVTDWNREQRLQGHSDVPLSTEGHWQALQLSQHLGAEAAPDLIFSSDLSRALHTAAYLARASARPVTPHAGLRERSFGAYEGRLWRELKEHLEASGFSGGLDNPAYRPPGGESLQDMEHRLLEFIQGLDAALRQARSAAECDEARPGAPPDSRRSPSDRTAAVWVISHGGTIRNLLRLLTGDPAPPGDAGFRLVNTGVSIVQRSGSDWSLKALNRAPHLELPMPEGWQHQP